MKRLILTTFGLFFFSFFSSSPIFASEEFETSYQVRYQISTDGKVRVIQDISLTNKLSNIYATEYTLSFQSTQIENLQAKDELGPIKTEVKQSGETTLVNLKFNQQVVGKDKILNFNLSYNALDLVNKTGQIWEISVPKLVNAAEINSYQLKLEVPTSFGTVAYISPNPISQSQEGNYQVYNFTKNQIAQAGVTAAFGQFQVFDFVLDYHLKNENLLSTKIDIALPPDTAFQQLYYLSIEPEPVNVHLDEDGNWLASYLLSSNQKLNIEVTGKVKIFSQPQKNFPQPKNTTLQGNLQEQIYWPVNHQKIQDIASQLKTVNDVYKYVVNYLDYDFERVKEGVERKGALAALENPRQAICMEFTDLFVSLARAIGVPAREINGYSYTTNPKLRPLNLIADVLHSWPEYWDEERKTWIPVDPTWEKTTGGINYFTKTDLNHFAFVIHGLDSQLPVPAGSYRQEGGSTKNIQVSFGKSETLLESKIEVEFNLPKSIYSKLKTNGNIEIKNLGPTAIYNLPTQISAENLEVSIKPDSELTIIPPFGKQLIPITVSNDNLFKIGQAEIKLALNGQNFSQSIKIKSLIWQGVLPVLGLFFLLISFVFFIFKLTVKKRRATKEV